MRALVFSRTRLASRFAVVLVLAGCFFAVGGGPSLHAAQQSYTSNGITMSLRIGNITMSGGGSSTPTGVWTGPPEQVGATQQISYSNGHTVYVAYFKGLGLTRPADPYTQILATDDWRTLNSSYSKSTDTIELVATNGSRFRRQYTPVYGVVVVMAPSVSEQADSNGATGSFGKLSLPDGSTQSILLPNTNWVAHFTTAPYLGNPQKVTAEPDIVHGGVTKPRFWGPSPSGAFAPSLYNETIDAGTDFAITVAGFSDDMHNGTIFAPPSGTPPTPNISITLMQGYTETRTAKVGWSAPGSVVTNSNSTVTINAGAGIPPVPPPPPPDQQLMRFAIMYVPGDSGELPDTGERHGGK